MIKGDTMGFDNAPMGLVVRDDTGYCESKVLCEMACQEIVKAVAFT
jgi:hypothetical protein